jgi:hypothetical protein
MENVDEYGEERLRKKVFPDIRWVQNLRVHIIKPLNVKIAKQVNSAVMCHHCPNFS